MLHCTVSITTDQIADEYEVLEAYYTIDYDGAITLEYLMEAGKSIRLSVNKKYDDEIMQQLEEHEIARVASLKQRID